MIRTTSITSKESAPDGQDDERTAKDFNPSGSTASTKKSLTFSPILEDVPYPCSGDFRADSFDDASTRMSESHRTKAMTNMKHNPEMQAALRKSKRSAGKQPFERLRSEVKYNEQRLLPDMDKPIGVILPWDPRYKAWWGFSVFWSIMTVFFETFQIAFAEAGLDNEGPPDGAFILGYVFVAVFSLDMVLSFNLAYFDSNDDIVTDRRKIGRRYMKCMFWVDLMGVFPFYNVVAAIVGDKASEETSEYLTLLRLLRLFRLVRLHRVKQLFDALQFNTHVSLMTLTLVRNFGTALVWTHFAACVMYYISRQYDFDETKTWIGGDWENLSTFERYLASLYWSVVTFTTVGYGDFSPVNSGERIWGVVYMLMNMVLSAWMIGSITLLIVKTDEQTGHYRDTLKTLDIYSQIHNFDAPMNKRLRSQMKLYFSYRQLADEEVLKYFPTLTRRKVLKRLYLPSIIKTSLMRGVRDQFIDAFLCCCRVEIFSPGEELLQRGSTSTELYLLVEGEAKLLSPIMTDSSTMSTDDDPDHSDGGCGYYMKRLGPGMFINDISFFTNTQMLETVQTTTICKALTLALPEFKNMSEDFPGSVEQILRNLLWRIEGVMSTEEVEYMPYKKDPKLTPPPAGGMFTNRDTSGYGGSGKSDDDKDDDDDGQVPTNANGVVKIPPKARLPFGETERKSLIEMQIHKLRDDQVGRLLFAASRGDTNSVTVILEQGFDPNATDYDSRTALMVAATRGCTDVAKKLFEYHADPNLRDNNGFTPLYDAIKNNHEATMDVIIENGGELCMDDELAALVLCKAVLDGQNTTLHRLLKAGINVNACGQDQRRAVHAAAMADNLVALKLLVEFDADLLVEDIWGNSVYDDAERFNSYQVMQYLQSEHDSGKGTGKSGWFR